MADKWEEIWNGKNMEDIRIINNDRENVFMQLKHAMGVTTIGKDGEIGFADFYNQFYMNYRELVFSTDKSFIPTSFFDVGCGTGAYLYLLKEMNGDHEVGGCDYGKNFIETARNVLGEVRELYCSEAAGLKTDIKYDCVYSRSIFQYFRDESYAGKVIEKMLEKANHSIGIFDVYDLKKQGEFIEYRKATVDNYEEKYAGISHLFLPKQMFLDIADKYGYAIKFSKSPLEHYWNDSYTYDVYIYKL